MIPTSNFQISDKRKMPLRMQLALKAHLDQQALQAASQGAQNTDAPSPSSSSKGVQEPIEDLLEQTSDAFMFSTLGGIDSYKPEEEAYQELESKKAWQSLSHSQVAEQQKQLEQFHSRLMTHAKKLLPESKYGEQIEAVESAYQKVCENAKEHDSQQVKDASLYTSIKGRQNEVQARLTEITKADKQGKLVGRYKPELLSHAFQTHSQQLDDVIRWHQNVKDAQVHMLTVHNVLGTLFKQYPTVSTEDPLQALLFEQALKNIRKAYTSLADKYTEPIRIQESTLKSQKGILNVQQSMVNKLNAILGKSESKLAQSESSQDAESKPTLDTIG